jgi:hypothetical protein
MLDQPTDVDEMKPFTRILARERHVTGNGIRRNLVVKMNYISKLGALPKFSVGNDFNSKICWLMINNSRSYHVKLSDKLVVKSFVSEIIGEEFVIKTLFETGDPADLMRSTNFPYPCFLKVNNDSGGTWLLESSGDLHDGFIRELRSRLERNYGRDKGEWYYQHIPPRVFIEELAFPNRSTALASDYKFHCVNGEVKFVQHICDRHRGKPREVILDVDGMELCANLDEKFSKGVLSELPGTWPTLVNVAQELSKGFPYVRVDLYTDNERVKFGEMTFHPRNGTYTGRGQEYLGALLGDIRAVSLALD